MQPLTVNVDHFMLEKYNQAIFDLINPIIQNISLILLDIAKSKNIRLSMIVSFLLSESVYGTETGNRFLLSQDDEDFAREVINTSLATPLFDLSKFSIEQRRLASELFLYYLNGDIIDSISDPIKILWLSSATEHICCRPYRVSVSGIFMFHLNNNRYHKYVKNINGVETETTFNDNSTYLPPAGMLNVHYPPNVEDYRSNIPVIQDYFTPVLNTIAVLARRVNYGLFVPNNDAIYPNVEDGDGFDPWIV